MLELGLGVFGLMDWVVYTDKWKSLLGHCSGYAEGTLTSVLVPTI